MDYSIVSVMLEASVSPVSGLASKTIALWLLYAQ